jgi:hypothetical protein
MSTAPPGQIAIVCPFCGKSGNVPETFRGKSIRCSGCNLTFIAGSAASQPRPQATLAPTKPATPPPVQPAPSIPEPGIAPPPLMQAAPSAISRRPGQPDQKPRTSGMAIASLVLGVCGLLGITALIGLILGVLGLRQINDSDGRLKGRGLAISGIIVSTVLLIAVVVGVGYAIPRMRFIANAEVGGERMKVILAALPDYITTHDYTMPPTESIDVMLQAIGVQQPGIGICPLNGQPYQTNPSLSRVSVARGEYKETAKSIVLLYQSSPTLGTRLVVYMNGKGHLLDEAEWPAVKAASGIP